MKYRQHLIFLIFIVATSSLFAQQPESAREAWHRLIPARQQKRPAFAWVERDPQLPNVFLYGDSISIGYTPAVRANLSGRANVVRLHANGGASSNVVEKMETMRKAMRASGLKGHWDFEWDAVHFNVGLHDLKYTANGKLDKKNGIQVTPPEQYEQQLREVIKYFRRIAPRATLIFAATTPVPKGEPGRIAGDAARYNAIAVRVLKDYPDVRFNDLHAFVTPQHSQWMSAPGNVHYNQTGSEALGKQVAEVIMTALEK